MSFEASSSSSSTCPIRETIKETFKVTKPILKASSHLKENHRVRSRPLVGLATSTPLSVLRTPRRAHAAKAAAAEKTPSKFIQLVIQDSEANADVPADVEAEPAMKKVQVPRRLQKPIFKSIVKERLPQELRSVSLEYIHEKLELFGEQ